MSEDEKAALLAKRDELRARIEAIEKDYRQGLDADAEEQALQLENAEVQAGIAKAAAEELAAIEEKLARLK
jgi:RNA polymerase-binding transcription factor DksA